MKNLQEIRAGLKMIREYHFAFRSAEKGVEILVPAGVKRLMDNYSRAIESASKPVRRVYRGLYENGLTQKALAAEWGVTEKYVQILNKRLLLHLEAQGLK